MRISYVMRIITIVLAFALSLAANAQTYYYQHTKTVYSNGQVKVESGNKGQFVCRTAVDGPKRCFDSTINGRNHLNGTLFYVGKSGNSDVYKGSSYFGENTVYQFNDSKGLLNIKDSRGNVYVYKRATPPAGKTVSSLISSKGSREGWDARDDYVDPINTATGDNNDASDSKKGGKEKTSPVTPTKDTGKCPTCKGKGRIRVHIGTGGYGVNNRKIHCNECGKDYFASEDHWHKCPACK